MSISIDKLSLLGALTPLRQSPDSRAALKEGGFAERFDKALGNGEPPVSNAGSKARELAQALTLQMLQSSLALAGDAVPENAITSGSGSSSSSIHALLQSYRDNLAKGGDQAPPPAVSQLSQPSQLAELAAETPVAAAAVINPSRSGSDGAWLDPIISRASRKYGVDAGLIKAVIKAESDFNPQAVSHAGARGLMQLMPATARSLGVNDSFDPEQNVMAGTRFLKDMLQRYGGDVDSALAAYNWGPGNVDRRPGTIPRETRDYLARVKQLLVSYSG